MDISIQQLRMLREFSRQPTIAKAADVLGYTPSAVSQQLSTAEKTTGVALLERVGRNVMLTDAGRELVVHAELILDNLDQAEAAIERLQGEASGELRVFFFESIGSTMLEPIMTRLRAAHPNLQLRTAFVDTDPSERVRRGELDVAFAVEREADSLERNDLDRMLVCRDWLRLAVPTGTLDAKGPIDLKVAAHYEFVAPPPNDAYSFAVNRAFATMPAPPVIAHRIADFPTVLRMVAAGAGAALVPDLGLVRVAEGVDLFELAHPQHRVIELLSRRSSAGRPSITAFKKSVVDVADELGLDRAEGKTK